MAIIKLQKVSKTFGNHVVLNNITYQFHPGKIYLLLGINGSGKSTLIKAILGLIKYTGEINIATNTTISTIPEAMNFPEYITCIDFLTNLAEIRGVNNPSNKIMNLLKTWELYEAKNKYIHQFSKGMKQKLLIINALIKLTSLYIFDEPLNGLDVKNQERFLSNLIQLKQANKTIIVATHYLSLYKHFSDYILEINNGSLYEKTV